MLKYLSFSKLRLDLFLQAPILNNLSSQTEAQSVSGSSDGEVFIFFQPEPRAVSASSNTEQFIFPT